MENVTDEVSNPFGMRPPCPQACAGAPDRRAVYGYGDANADFHVIGDHSAVHGGAASGVPFTGHPTGERVLDVLETVDLLVCRDGPELRFENCFCSYRYCCCVAPGAEPTPDQYREFERFFDAELRAIAADVLLPIGEGPTRQVLETYTAQAHRLDDRIDDLHARQVRGRGFLVLPMRNPDTWAGDDAEAIVDALRTVLAMDYRQFVDLGRFIADDEPYFVR